MLLESRQGMSVFHLLLEQCILDRSGRGLFWIKELDKIVLFFKNIHTSHLPVQLLRRKH